ALLAVVGAVFVIEALSVMIQVGWFKVSGGRRVFRCSPLHHHYQFGGWHETRVTRRFLTAACICALAGLAMLPSLMNSGPVSDEFSPTEATAEVEVDERPATTAVLEHREK
ncbi:MAG: hypothetical protein OEY28_10720, partial [Nitrospira sp.]|nr:hypothetical protein [Nitrospira sp.]